MKEPNQPAYPPFFLWIFVTTLFMLALYAAYVEPVIHQ